MDWSVLGLEPILTQLAENWEFAMAYASQFNNQTKPYIVRMKGNVW